VGGWPKGRGCWGLAALLGCVGLLVLAPAALAAGGTGEISGTVIELTKSEDIIPLQNIEITVYEAHGKESPVGFATTEAQGKYMVEALPEGEYKVEFSAGFESNQNFITQFYKNKSSFAAAESVKVVIGKPTESEGINAEMEVGGEIEGTVTDASTHKPVPIAEVVALGPGEAVEGFAITNASGQYTMQGLAPNSYMVGFASAGYVIQYYNDQPSFAFANPVAVSQGSTVPGVNAALMPKAPINTLAPVASGTPAAGQTLSCTSGSWTGTPVPTFAYSWLRDGVAIPGTAGSTYVVQAADQGNGLTCKVTATNKSGAVAAVSNTLIVPVPAVAPPKPVIMLSSSKIVVTGSSAGVPIACANATCAGTIELTEQIVVKHRRGRRTISSKHTLILGHGSYALEAGHSATVVVHLTATARNALARARNHRLSVRVSASVLGGTTASRSVVLIQRPAKHMGRRG
jgi:Carboxypeptidase regulatory-like domain